jgi:hypothetical protein
VHRYLYPYCKTFPTVCKSILFGKVCSVTAPLLSIKNHAFDFIIRIQSMKSKVTVQVISSFLVALFTYAAVSKLLDYETFSVQLSKSPFISKFSHVMSWALPLIEIILSLLMVFKRTLLIGLYGSLFLMTTFSAYIYAMLHYSYYLPCSCGGILSNMSWITHLWFNVIFTIMTVIGIFIHSNSSVPIKVKDEMIDERTPLISHS